MNSITDVYKLSGYAKDVIDFTYGYNSTVVMIHWIYKKCFPDITMGGATTSSHIWSVLRFSLYHYSDVIMRTMASQITSLTVVYSNVYSGADQMKHQSSTSLTFVGGIHWWPVNSPQKGTVKNPGNVTIWWRHHVKETCMMQKTIDPASRQRASRQHFSSLQCFSVFIAIPGVLDSYKLYQDLGQAS